MHLAIDATNIRQGGGLTHLSRLLHAADPLAVGIDKVTVWASTATARTLPDRPWLYVRSAAWMDAAVPRRAFGQQFQLPAELAEAGCGLLFSPGGTLPARCSVPTVTMSQNMLPFEPQEAVRFGAMSPTRLKMRLLRMTQGRSFQRADGVIFLTEYAQAAVSAALHLTNPATLIPHGIESRFLQAPRPPRLLEDCSVADPFRLLYVSILMPYKHQIAVAHAVSRLRAEGLSVTIRFVGASWGWYGRQFAEVLQKLDPAGDFLQWSGAEPFEVVHDFYKNADIFVFASSCENLPNIMIEAMAAGLPIASSDRGPMPEVLQGAGLYFDPEQPDVIATTVRTLALDAVARRRYAEMAWEKAQQYSWQRCASDTFKFIADVASKKKAINSASQCFM